SACERSAPAPGSPAAISPTRVRAAGVLFGKASTTTTSHPAVSSPTAVWLPMYPAPPVSKTVPVTRLRWHTRGRGRDPVVHVTPVPDRRGMPDARHLRRRLPAPAVRPAGRWGAADHARRSRPQRRRPRHAPRAGRRVAERRPRPRRGRRAAAGRRAGLLGGRELRDAPRDRRSPL